jgi:membrane-bound acyltransferase YfiQ involved in biofilm formation
MPWVDALRLLAGVSMVVMHASIGPDGGVYPDAKPAERAVPVIIHGLAYLARTELFVIISLFLLTISMVQRPRGYWQTVKEQAKRLLIPFLFWAVFYITWNIFKGYHLGYGHWLVRDLGLIESWFGYFLLGDMKQTMHFLPTLFVLVLCFPLYRYAMRYPALGLTILATLALRQELNHWIWAKTFDPVIEQYLLRGTRILSFLGYGMLAASFYGLVSNPKFRNWYWPVLSLMIFALCWLGAVKFSQTSLRIETGQMEHNFPMVFWANFLIPALLFGLALFIRLPWPDVLSRLAPLSFGIYLIHPFFLDIHRMTFHTTIADPTIYALIKIAFAVSMSFVASSLLARISWLAWTVGRGKFSLLKSKITLGRISS